MKATLLSFFVFWFASISSLSAQVITQIGTGTQAPLTNNSIYSPMCRFDASSTNDCSRSNLLYTDVELNNAGITAGSIINKIAFYKIGVGASTGGFTFEIHMRNSATTAPLSATLWSTILTTHTPVYVTTNQTVAATAGWVEFTLTTPFVYTGQNLEIAMTHDMTGIAGNPSTGPFDWQYTNGFQDYIIGIVGTSPPANLNGTVTNYKVRPNIQFHYTPGTPCSGPPVAGNSVANPTTACQNTSVTLSLANNIPQANQTYTWQYSAAMGGPYVNVTASSSNSSASVTATATGYYQCEVACGTSTTTSAPVYVVVNQSLPGGTYTINNTQPTGGSNFASFTDAFAALNCGVSGNVVLDVSAGQTFSETLPELNFSGSSGTTITFQKSGSGANPVIIPAAPGTIASSTTIATHGDAVIVINGGDYITFDGIDINTSGYATGNDRFEYGYYLKKMSSTDACKNVTIKNATISLAAANIFSFGIFVSNNMGTTTGITVGSTGGRSENIKISGNTIANAYGGILVRGYAASSPYDLYDQNIEIGVDGGNTITNFGGGATTSYGIYTIYQNNLKIANNSITSAALGHTTTLYGIYATTATNASGEVYGNSVTIHGKGTTTTIYGIYCDMGGTGTNNLLSFHDNTVSNCTYTTATTGAFYGMYFSGTIYRVHAFRNRVINNSFSPTTTGVFGGIYQTGSLVNELRMYDNRVSGNIKTSGTTGAFYGIYSTPTTTTSTYVYNDTVYNNQAVSSSGIMYGIYQASGLVNSVYGNYVYGLVNSSTTTGAVHGIAVTAGATVNVYNNFVSDLQAITTSSADAIRGISITSTTTSSSDSVSNNTVFLNSSSSGTNFGTSGLYVTTSATATTASLTLRNNNVVNVSTPLGTGVTAAYRRSSTSLTNYNSLSNNNNFYAGTPSSANLIFYDGTNADQTIGAYQTRVSPADNVSISENPTFVNTTSPPYDLHINTSVPTFLEGGGANIPSVTVDIDGEVRNGIKPDIGADEFSGIPLPITLMSFTGERRGAINRLLWETANEVNSAGFEVQRSADGTNFIMLGFVKSGRGSHNSNEARQYNFDDTAPVNGTNYYRLKQIDLDNKFEFSKVISIRSDRMGTVKVVSVYPNPVKEVLSIQFEASTAQQSTVLISDVTGRVIMRQPAQLAAGAHQLEVPVSSLATGSYFVTISCADGCETLVHSFIKK